MWGEHQSCSSHSVAKRWDAWGSIIDATELVQNEIGRVSE